MNGQIETNTESADLATPITASVEESNDDLDRKERMRVRKEISEFEQRVEDSLTALSPEALEALYLKEWKDYFGEELRAGRTIEDLQKNQNKKGGADAPSGSYYQMINKVFTRKFGYGDEQMRVADEALLWVGNNNRTENGGMPVKEQIVDEAVSQKDFEPAMTEVGQIEKPLSRSVDTESKRFLADQILETSLAYQDTDLPDEQKLKMLEWSKSSPSARRYADSLVELSEKSNIESVRALAKEIVEKGKMALVKLGVKGSSFSGSQSWAMWDIGKQYYFFTHKDEADPNYLNVDPLSSTEKQQEIIYRHIGWEVFQNPDKTFLEKFRNTSTYSEVMRLLKKPPKENGQLSSKDLATLGELLVKMT